MPFTDYVAFPGSEKLPHPRAELLAPLADDARFAITIMLRDDERAIVRDYLDSVGLTSVEDRGETLRVAGSAAQFQSAFRVSLAEARVDGQVIRHRSGSIMVPKELVGPVTAILDLDSRPQARPHLTLSPRTATAYTIPQLAARYGAPTSGVGTLGTIGIISLGGGVSPADVSGAGEDPSLTAVKLVDGATNAYTGDPNSADAENALDEQISGFAAAKRIIYIAPNTDGGFVDAILAAVNDCSVISVSWGSEEANWTQQAVAAMEQAFAKAVAAGISVFVASGDSGSSDGGSGLNVDYPAASPNVCGCGGTTITGAQVGQETAWADGGGGYSKLASRPAWQSGSNPMRGVPDLAADADPSTGWIIYLKGEVQFGGTSCVAPFMAGMCELLQRQTGKKFGNFAQTIAPFASVACIDITQGSNGAYKAGTGWDPCTGWGAPICVAMLQPLGGTAPQPTPPTKLTVNPTIPRGVVAGVPAQFSAIANLAGATFIWSFDGVTGSGQSVVKIFAQQGTFTGSVTASAAGQTATSAFTVVVTAPSTPKPGPTPPRQLQPDPTKPLGGFLAWLCGYGSWQGDPVPPQAQIQTEVTAFLPWLQEVQWTNPVNKTSGTGLA